MSSGLQTQFGLKAETTYGTPVVVDRFYEILNESLERRNQTITSNGLRNAARNLRRGSRRVLTASDGGGDVNFEVATTGFGVLFNHMLGGTSTIAQQGATPAWLQTHTLGDLEGKSLTLQKGVSQTDGTVKPFTFHGCKVLGWEFSISVDQILQLRCTFDAEDVDTSTGLATASYPTSNLFHFKQGTLSVEGSSVAQVTDASVNGTNNLKVDRFYLGSNGLKKEPLDNDYPEVGGSLTAEFVDLTTFHDRFAADSAAELELEFVGAVIDGAESETLTITVPEVRFEGETPKVSGPEVNVQNIPFVGLFDGTNAGTTIEYKSTDTAI